MRKTRGVGRGLVLTVVILFVIVSLAGCLTLSGRSAAPPVERASNYLSVVPTAPSMAPRPMQEEAATVGQKPGTGEQSVSAGPVAYPGYDRKIVKNAEISLQVQDTNNAIDQVTGLATDFSGYVVSSRTWDEGPYRLATVTISVPVDSFEQALRRLHSLAVKVLREQSTGEDVTEQYVDLESRLRNLEATQTRIRAFLEQAVSVQEALEVNRQLTEIEGQIEDVKGKMQYLKARAAFSTIAVSLEPVRPTPTPTPTPTLPAWQPVQTFNDAGGVLVQILRFLGDLVIWLAVVLLPFVVPLVVVIWLIVRWIKGRRGKKGTVPPEGHKG
jgi:hypothetical protein